MNDKIPEEKTGVSPPAASMARTIDRLPPGDYMIRLEKPRSNIDRWGLEIYFADMIMGVKQKAVPSRAP